MSKPTHISTPLRKLMKQIKRRHRKQQSAPILVYTTDYQRTTARVESPELKGEKS